MTEEIQEVTISFRYKFEDYKKAFLSNYYRGRIGKSAIFLVSILILAGGGFLAYNIVMSSLSINNLPTILICFGVAIVIIFRPYIALNTIRQQCLTTFEFGHKDYKVSIGNNGIHWKTSNGEQFLSWNIIFKVVEQKDSFCFYQNILEHRIVPKRILDPNQVMLLRKILRTNIGQNYHTQGLNTSKITE
jgi:hypothetical protein